MKRHIRALIAEDSRTVRAILHDALTSAGVDVVGEAEDGRAAVTLAAELRPDVVTMDIAMPGMDGLAATEAIMAAQPSRIIVVCALDDEEAVARSMRAMAAGALEVVAKPAPGGGPGSSKRFGAKVIEAVRLMAEVPVVTRRRSHWAMPSPLPVGARVAAPSLPPPPSVAVAVAARGELAAIGIVASTGGPPALAQILKALPASLPSFVLVAQHMAPGFLPGLMRWFSEATRLTVVTAHDGERARPGCVYLPPDDHDLVVVERGVLGVARNRGSIAPSGDALLASLASAYGARAAGVVLTGMGDDGAAGLLALKRAGALTIAQDRETSVVHGMPRAAVDAGAADHVLPLDAVARFLLDAIGK